MQKPAKSFMVIAIIACPLLATDARAQMDNVAVRDINDFIENQGQFDSSTNECVEGAPDFLSVSDPNSQITAAFDYAGLYNQTLGEPIDTTFDGTVVVRRLDDDRVKVSVVLHTDNAFTCAAFIDGEDDPLARELTFGYSGDEVLDSADPALSDLTLRVDFITAIDEDETLDDFEIPDLIQIIFNPEEEEDELLRLSLVARGEGDLREPSGYEEGTTGRIGTTQVGIFGVPASANSALADGFPVERIDLQPIGP